MFGTAMIGGTGVAVLCGPVGSYCTSRLPELRLACLTVSGLPPTVNVQLRALAVLFALATMVTCPLPVPFTGETVSQSGQGLTTVQAQFEPLTTVTSTFVLPPSAPIDAELEDSKN